MWWIMNDTFIFKYSNWQPFTSMHFKTVFSIDKHTLWQSSGVIEWKALVILSSYPTITKSVRPQIPKLGFVASYRSVNDETRQQYTCLTLFFLEDNSIFSQKGVREASDSPKRGARSKKFGNLYVRQSLTSHDYIMRWSAIMRKPFDKLQRGIRCFLLFEGWHIHRYKPAKLYINNRYKLCVTAP